MGKMRKKRAKLFFLASGGGLEGVFGSFGLKIIAMIRQVLGFLCLSGLLFGCL